MKTMLTIVAMAVTVTTSAMAPAQTTAADHRYHGRSRTYHYRCKKSSGRTGLIAGAGGGGLGAAALGAGPVGVVAGAVGGGLLGRHIDKKHDAAQNRRNGC